MIKRRENAIGGKQLDSVWKETHVVSVMIEHLETDAIRGKKDNCPVLHQKQRHRLTGRYPQEVALLEKEAELRADISLGESVRTRHVIIGTLPCLNYKSLSGCTCGDKCRFRHAEVGGQPSEKSKKSGVKDQLSYERSLFNWMCVSRFSSKHAVRFSKGTWHHIELRERKGPSRGVIQKCEPHERNPCASRFEERTQEETLHQERCACRVAWNLAKIFTSSKIWRATSAPTPKSLEERTL